MASQTRRLGLGVSGVRQCTVATGERERTGDLAYPIDWLATLVSNQVSYPRAFDIVLEPGRKAPFRNQVSRQAAAIEIFYRTGDVVFRILLMEG